MSPGTVCLQHLLLCCYHSPNPFPSSLFSSMKRCQFKSDTDFIYFLLRIVINRLLRKCFQNHLSQGADIYLNIGKRVSEYGSWVGGLSLSNESVWYYSFSHSSFYLKEQFLFENNRIQNRVFYTFIHSTEEMWERMYFHRIIIFFKYLFIK